jgi:hypothetical protein
VVGSICAFGPEKPGTSDGIVGLIIEFFVDQGYGYCLAQHYRVPGILLGVNMEESERKRRGG